MKRGGRLQRRTPLRNTGRLRRISQRQMERNDALAVERMAAAIRGDKCAFPGCTDLAADLHHVKLRSRGGSDDASNLAALCSEHHLLCHDRPKLARELGLMKASWEA